MLPVVVLVVRVERGLGFATTLDADLEFGDTLPLIFFLPVEPDAGAFFLALRGGELRLDDLLTAEELFAALGTEVLELERSPPPVKSPLGPITVRVGAETLAMSSSSEVLLVPIPPFLAGVSTSPFLDGRSTDTSTMLGRPYSSSRTR